MATAGAGQVIYSLGADGQDPTPRLFYAIYANELFEVHWTGAGWSGPTGDAGSYVAPTIGVGYRPASAPNGDGNSYVVICSGNPTFLQTRQFNTASGTWGPVSQLIAAGVNTGYSYGFPRLAETRQDCLRQVYTWAETAPAPLGTTSQVSWTPTHAFIGSTLPWPYASGSHGLRVFQDGGASPRWWLITPSAVWSVPADVADAATGQRVRFANDQIVALRIDQPRENHPASVLVTVLNSDGALKDAGQAGPHQGLRQWSQLALTLGYHTSAGSGGAGLAAGDEGAWQIPAWIEQIVFHDDVATGEPLVTFHCIDAWGLLDRLTVRSAVTYVNVTAAWVLENIFWHVGGDLDLSPNPLLANLTLASFTLRAGETHGDAARRLCERAGVVLRFWTNPTSADGTGWDSVRQSVVAWASGSASYHYGPNAGQHPILRSALAPLTVPSATGVEVVGQSTTSVARDTTRTLLLGHDVLARLVDKTLTSQAATDAAATNQLAWLSPEGTGGEIETFANVGLEVGDVVEVTIASAPVNALRCTVAGITTTWNRDSRGMRQVVKLEGASAAG